MLWECQEAPSVPSATLAPWSDALWCTVAVPAQAVPGAGAGALTSTTSLIRLSCTKGTFRDSFIREKKGNRAGNGAAQSFCQQLVQYTLRIVSCTDRSVTIPCTHLVLQHLQGRRTLVQPWPLGRSPLPTESTIHLQGCSVCPKFHWN